MMPAGAAPPPLVSPPPLYLLDTNIIVFYARGKAVARRIVKDAETFFAHNTPSLVR